MYAQKDLVSKAIKVATEAQTKWDAVPLEEKISIWLKAADLMATKYRMKLNAATMLGQSKTVIQAEIDAAAELIDFIKFVKSVNIIVENFCTNINQIID